MREKQDRKNRKDGKETLRLFKKGISAKTDLERRIIRDKRHLKRKEKSEIDE